VAVHTLGCPTPPRRAAWGRRAAVGVLDKVGHVRHAAVLLRAVSQGAKYFTPLVITLSVIGILYGAIVAIGQQSMKRLIAYTSVSHVRLIALGISR